MPTSDPGTATLNNDVVSSYQKNGITVDGTGSSAAIGNVTVTGAGETTAIAQNGIQISDGATARISGWQRQRERVRRSGASAGLTGSPRRRPAASCCSTRVW